MSSDTRYHLTPVNTPGRFQTIPKNLMTEREGCLGCLVCVKRDCPYDVHKDRRYVASELADTRDVACKSCFKCVQECKKGILGKAPNPVYERLGDHYWTPDIISAIWTQSTTGAIPVSGAGYPGKFSGPGFDEMWTDMSEIVRPTRDGIHGREYISTSIDIGRRLPQLEFTPDGRLAVEPPPQVVLPIPVIFDLVSLPNLGPRVTQATISAAREVGNIAILPASQNAGAMGPEVAPFYTIEEGREVKQGSSQTRMVVVNDGDGVEGALANLRRRYPGAVMAVRVELGPDAGDRAVALAQANVEVIHLVAALDGFTASGFMKDALRMVHDQLVSKGIRDQITLLAGGGVGLAEHVAKALICGADAVTIDAPLFIALECRWCGACFLGDACPVEVEGIDPKWGAGRIRNLMAAWHSQVIEVLGAMGIREVRRLRGEVGRAMFAPDLEESAFANLTYNAQATTNWDGAEMPTQITPVVKPTPSRYRHPIGKHLIRRSSACIACGKCAELCPYGVHKVAGPGRMLEPKSSQCIGVNCVDKPFYCITRCPQGALKMVSNPIFRSMGEKRWTSDLLVSTWVEASSGKMPEGDLECEVGDSGGGFDRLRIKYPDGAALPEDTPVDLTVVVNRRHDGRREIRLGMPIYGGGMSFGSVSRIAMEARARAYKHWGSFTCTGEGGYPDALVPHASAVITQVATGLFGVREDTIKRAPIVEFKYAQGAKPGLGGHLLGDKVTEEVARMRDAVVGSALFSPFPFHSVYSVEDHKKHVDWIKAMNPEGLVSVKVSTPTDVDMVAIGSYYAGAHIIHLDGSYGGTGAAPDIAKKNIAMPIEYAIPKAHRFLVEEGVREQVTLVASGGLRSPYDVVKAICMGADAVVIGTADLVALECIRCHNCESGRGCPRGIATTDPKLQSAVDLEWATQRIINMYAAWNTEIARILRRLGLRSVSQLVGRTDFLVHLDHEVQA
jgi:glutamate synthase domain-containing protein 2/Fe-S-cluster-containing dehydrogenase component